MKINNILCEYLNNPIGIGILNPRITWDLDGVKHQKAFEIKYRINEKEYNSGIVTSSSMNYMFLDKFSPRDIVTYSIRVQDQNDNWSDYSEEKSFEFGLLDEKFKAHWITGNYKPKKNVRYPADQFRKIFNFIKSLNT